MLAAYRVERPFTGARARGPAAAGARRRAALSPDPAVRLAEPGRGRAGQAQGPARVPRQAALPPRPVRARRLRSGLILATRSAAGSETVEIHTDGACSGNPGPGGWGAVLRWRGQVPRALRLRAGDHQQPDGARGGDRGARDAEAADDGRAVHRQQLSAPRASPTWLPAWKARGWQTADKKPVKNQDLWQRLEQALGRHRIVWRWVKGHSGNPDNERADELARAGDPRRSRWRRGPTSRLRLPRPVAHLSDPSARENPLSSSRRSRAPGARCRALRRDCCDRRSAPGTGPPAGRARPRRSAPAGGRRSPSALPGSRR